MIVNLKDIKIGQSVSINKIDIENKKRLLELGFVENKKIKKEYESIDKKMIGIKIDGQIIGLRSSMCENIYVKVGD